MMNLKSWLWFVLLVVVGVLTRWIPHPPNFSALLAVALFAGFVLPAPLALVAPVLSAFLGDTWLGFHDQLWVVYLSVLAIVFLGRGHSGAEATSARRSQPGVWGWTVSGFAASVFFYITTNLAVWWTSGLYAHTVDGLSRCYVLALPFFGYSLLSTWVYLGVFEAVRRYALTVEPAPARQ